MSSWHAFYRQSRLECYNLLLNNVIWFIYLLFFFNFIILIFLLVFHLFIIFIILLYMTSSSQATSVCYGLEFSCNLNRSWRFVRFQFKCILDLAGIDGQYIYSLSKTWILNWRCELDWSLVLILVLNVMIHLLIE